ncbi:MAG: arginine--tRNA ligase [Eubacterium sp.]|nr:arginine--tRNA ligase [Eubacterium sp.]
MKKILELITEEFEKAFEDAGYDKSLAIVGVSNRPDLCEYQCNGAMAGAKKYGKAPIAIAEEIVDVVKDNEMFSKVEAINPGFINIDLNNEFVAKYLNDLEDADNFGVEKEDKTIVVDYGGANAAKPLHVGHLRSAVIGESIKRIKAYMGNNVIGDVHLGDWGLQMGLIIMELKDRKPDLPYFDEDFDGEYPQEAPFDIAELEEIYPAASAKAAEDEEFKEAAGEATRKLQDGYKPYRALWKHIMNVSLNDLKKNYDRLDTHFDLWKGESDANPYIEDLIQELIDKGLAYESEGALVVDIKKDDDKKEYPPCIVRKSDGAALYATSDLGTIIEREKDYQPDEYIYITDKRQELHFTQVFRVAKKAGFVPQDRDMEFIGFGTVNGKDGKPFKTRDGGVYRLEYLIDDINDAVFEKMKENKSLEESEAKKVSEIVGLAALKYGDLSNQANKDYIFDLEKFASFEGNTGPYILYTIVRIKSILEKYKAEGGTVDGLEIKSTDNESQKKLMMELVKVNEVIESASEELAPHRICQYIYELSNTFNGFYHDTKILTEEDEDKKKGYIALLNLTKKVLETGIDLLGFSAPDKM